MATPPPVRKPGGARPAPSRIIPPPKLDIPEGNVPGINVDSANENGWHQPSTSFPPIPNPTLPSLALNPMARSSSSLNTSRPKLSLSGFSTPSAGNSPSLLPSSTQIDPPPITAPFPALSTGRPALLNAPSASTTPRPNRSLTPSLKLAIPNGQGQGSNFSASHDYPPATPPLEDDYTLNTPTASHSGEDRNPTLVPRGRDYDGDEESSYGYGRLNNGLGIRNGSEGGDAMSSMTADIRQALSRSRINVSASGSAMSTNNGHGHNHGYGLVYSGDNAQAGGSQSSSRASSIRRQGRGRDTGLPELAGLSLDERRGSVSSGRSTPVQMGTEGEDAGERGESPVVKDPERLVVIRRLGEGSGGAVELVKDPETGRLLAKKVIARTANPTMHRQLLRELEILNACSSPYIVDHYGSFLADHDSQIGILMEYCEGGSLDSSLSKMKKTGMRCSEHVLGRIASSVLRGLDYLHERRIIHRDIKPSNILVTKSGQCKLCDFGVSGELVDSVAGTFTGTSYYMAPERIQGKSYSIRADVWSLGLTLHEIAHLRFPFPPEGENEYVAPIELLSYIVTAPVPQMIDDESVGRVWSDAIKSFMKLCLIRSGTDRPYPRELLQHPFITTSEAKKVNMTKWVAALLDS